ncbi:SGF29 tudor-like domain-containing protein [Mucidula mucida]|nr:SGF29 tudor-like domain-containing protein [Mucidula mucida]
MDRKRGFQTRPAASEEMNVWSQARGQLLAFTKTYTANPGTAETIDRVNRLIAVWPSDDTAPSEGLAEFQGTHDKLKAGLQDIETASLKEVRMIEAALEKLGVLIALRQAPEPVLDKRNKRPRAPSPSHAVAHATQPSTASRTSVLITLPPRNAAGTPLGSAVVRGSGTRKDNLSRQLPLKPGRQIAFHTPIRPDKDENEGSDWILANVTRCLGDKTKYEVRDADDDNPETYVTTLASMIPLPVAGVPEGAPESLSSYPEHAKGSTVLALYPDTSCFYRAEVMTTPDREKTKEGVVPTYVLRFEDDGDADQPCPAYYVVDLPKEWV